MSAAQRRQFRSALGDNEEKQEWQIEHTKMGHLVEVIGPVVDVQFEEGHLPLIHNAVRITSEGFDVPEPMDIVAEVEQHLGEGRVRCVAMKPTEGLVRGMKAVDLGEPISVPVGRATLGRVLNVLGRTGRQARPGEDQTSAIRFTARRRRSKTSPPRWKCSRRESRSST